MYYIGIELINNKLFSINCFLNKLEKPTLQERHFHLVIWNQYTRVSDFAR